MTHPTRTATPAQRELALKLRAQRSVALVAAQQDVAAVSGSMQDAASLNSRDTISATNLRHAAIRCATNRLWNEVWKQSMHVQADGADEFLAWIEGVDTVRQQVLETHLGPTARARTTGDLFELALADARHAGAAAFLEQTGGHGTATPVQETT